MSWALKSKAMISNVAFVPDGGSAVTVMRLLHQSYQGEGAVNIGGLKIDLGAEEWVHIGPNPERPLFEIRVEARDPERATALVKEHGDQLLQWIVASES